MKKDQKGFINPYTGEVSVFPTQFTEYKVKGEVNNSPSKTIPDEHVNIRELLGKHLSGNMPDGAQNMQYSGDGVVTPYIDISQVHEQSLKAEETIRQYNLQQQKIEREKLTLKQKQAREKLEKEIREQLAKEGND